MRRLDWLMIVALVVVALAGKFFNFDEGQSRSENPRRPSPEYFEPKFWNSETQSWLASSPGRSNNEIPASAQLPRVGVIEESDKKGSSVGSAFSISERGLWLTARHVVAGCDKTMVQIGNKKALEVTQIKGHPSADIALLTTRSAPKPLVFSQDSAFLRHAYGVGFPTGQPGAVHGRFIGEMTMHHRGRNGFRERVNAWTERSRIPNRSGSLGGLSGGAVIDERGHIIGIVQAESRRRGRFMTAKLDTIEALLSDAAKPMDRASSGADEFSLSADGYPKTARQLITTLRVAKVLCFVN